VTSRHSPVKISPTHRSNKRIQSPTTKEFSWQFPRAHAGPPSSPSSPTSSCSPPPPPSPSPPPTTSPASKASKAPPSRPQASTFANRLNDSEGHKIPNIDFNAFVYAQVPRLVYISDLQLLGGYLGVDGLVPIQQTDTKVNTPGGPFDSATFGVGDPFVEATWSWHTKPFDFSLGAGEWIPAGASEAPPSTKPGLGYWGTMLTAGATWYPDDAKTWALSLLNRYEINCESRDTHITPGNAYTLEWGASKTVLPILDLGLVGYYQQKVTPDAGTGSNHTLDKVAAIGPEVILALPAQKVFISLRYDYEFWSEARAQGNTVTLTLTYRF